MQRHPYFELYLHDDHELAPFVGGEIVERQTVHEWPLSCVQRLTTRDGRRLIYKSQFGPTVEPEFYANAKSDLLVPAETIYRSGGHSCMLFGFAEGHLLALLDLLAVETAQIGRQLIERIAAIRGELPHYLDVSSVDKWAALISELLKTLDGLAADGTFVLVDRETVRRLGGSAFAAPTLAVLREKPGYVHGDLGGDNVFATDDGYRVIDWQRPILGPTDLDLANLMEALGFDPLRYVGEGIVRVMYLLRIHWLTQCTVRWFPQGTKTYEETIVQLAQRLDAL